MVCSPPGSSVHGILQARILQWVAIPFSMESSQPRDWTRVSCIAGRFFMFWALAVQRTLKSLLQHHNSKASVLWCSDFFMVQLSHSYMTTGKTITLTIWTFVGKMMSLLFNMMSRFAIDFLPGSKCLLILWLQSQCRLSLLNLSDLGAQENKICHCSYIFPIYSLWSDGIGCHDLSILNVEF